MPLFDLFSPNIDKLKAKRDIQGLVKALQSPKEDIQLKAVKALGEIGDVQATQPLIHLLNSAKENIQLKAVKALGEIGDVQATQPIIHLLNSENWWVRVAAIEALGNIRDSSALTALQRGLNDQALPVRVQTVKALSNIGDESVIDPLAVALKDEKEGVRDIAEQALGKIENPKAQSLVLEYREQRKAAEEARRKREEERIRSRPVQQPGSFSEKEYVICTNCGAGYNTEMVAESIFLTSPFMADMKAWNTRVICKNCRQEIWVEGSYRRVFGQPGPR